MTVTAAPPAFEGCPTCKDHFARRGRALCLAVVLQAVRHNISAPDLLRRHMAAIHARHRAGYSLALDAGPNTLEPAMTG